MIVEIAVAAWVCFSGVLCYDSGNVAVAGDKVATMLSDGESIAGIIVDCKTRTHRVIVGRESAEVTFEPGSVADTLCRTYLPEG